MGLICLTQMCQSGIIFSTISSTNNLMMSINKIISLIIQEAYLSLIRLTQHKVTIRFGQPRAISIELHFKCTLDSLSIVFFHLGYVIQPQQSKGLFIRYFKPIWMSLSLCIQIMFSFFHSQLLYMNSTSTRFCSNCKLVAYIPKGKGIYLAFQSLSICVMLSVKMA